MAEYILSFKNDLWHYQYKQNCCIQG